MEWLAILQGTLDIPRLRNNRRLIQVRTLSYMTKNITKKGIIVIADQIIVSVGNFIVTFALARYLSKEDFGIFVLAHSILMLSMQIHTALITSPIGVLVSPLSELEAKEFVKALNSGQRIISVFIGGGVLFAAGFMTLSQGTRDYSAIFIATAIIIFFYLGQSYIRYILFSRMRLVDALKNDLVCYGLQAIAIVLLLLNNILSSVTAIYAIGVTSLVAWIYGLYQCREYMGKSNVPVMVGLRPCINYGKWLVGTGVLAWCRANLHLYVALYFLGITAPAILKAVQTLFGPTHIFLNGLQSIVPQYSAKLYKKSGDLSLVSFVLKFSTALGVIMIGYALVVSIYGDAIMNILYKGQYAGYGWIVVIIAIQYVIISLQVGPNILLRVKEFPKLIFKANAIDLLFSGIVTVALIAFFGIYGAAVSKVFSSFVILILLIMFYKMARGKCI